MKRIWEIIPSRENIDQSLALSEKYQVAFEYNDFMMPFVLDNVSECKKIIDFYKNLERDRSMDTMHGAFLDVTVHSSDSLIREASERRVYHSLEIARELGIRGVVFHTGLIANYYADFYRKQWLEKNTVFWTKASKEFSDVQIYMENMFEQESDMLASLGKEMSSIGNFGLCLDYAHASVFGIHESPSHWFESICPYMKHMHINDNDLTDDQHLAVGSGKIDWKKFGKLLMESKWKASILIETKSVSAQKRSLEYLEKTGILDI